MYNNTYTTQINIPNEGINFPLVIDWPTEINQLIKSPRAIAYLDFGT